MESVKTVEVGQWLRQQLGVTIQDCVRQSLTYGATGLTQRGSRPSRASDTMGKPSERADRVRRGLGRRVRHSLTYLIGGRCNTRVTSKRPRGSLAFRIGDGSIQR
jgi:hypothetical protein